MDSAAAGGSQPGYPEIYVGQTCHVQTPESRFGRDVLEDLKVFVFESPHDNMTIDDDDDEDEGSEDGDEDDYEDADMYEAETTTVGVGFETDPNHARHGFPRIATTRNNLTGLSQRYNLYFAAYQDRIYVYQPRRAPQILPSPSLILHPRASKLGICCGGAQDRNFPHQVNHMTVGNLGNLEMVLLAYDDGDVIGYYTHAIARWISTNNDHAREPRAFRVRQTPLPKPFFHENVGKSAWGLKIHEQSRLIAVGSNLHEVTVFAFAVSHNNKVVKFPEVDNSPRVATGQTAFELQKHFQSRTRTWRITLPLSRTGNNIPNLDFLDDEFGEADKVVAMDISGDIWILEIWKIGALPIQWRDDPDPTDRALNPVRGWGVLVLPDSSFKPTRNVRECLGAPAGEVLTLTINRKTTCWIDSTCSLYHIKDLSPNPNIVFRQRARFGYESAHISPPTWDGEGSLSDIWDSSSDYESEVDDVEMISGPKGDPMPTGPGPERWLAITPHSGLRKSSLDDDPAEDVQLSRCIIPTFGEVPNLDGSTILHMDFNKRFAERQSRTKCIDFSKAELPAHVRKHFFVLRTHPTDFQLQPFDPATPSVECKFVLASHGTGTLNPPWDLNPAYSERVSMLLHVPELNLVVAGSPNGRVALLTLTKANRRIQNTPVRRGFRVDRVLPRRGEDMAKLRPACTLVGVAMSPVPDHRARGLELFPPGGRRAMAGGMYRLMLHYKDHTILMYDVARGVEEDELMIF